MLVDAAQFYVSCERVFQAALHARPTIVLSNNDGCIVALSKEASKLGLARGQPLFQCQQIIRAHHVQVYSSNYPLYQEMSARVRRVLAEFSPRLEEYSIDESWLELTDLAIDDLTEFGCMVKARVYQDTGIPVRVAIAPTKCLTKIACNLLKGDERYNDVVDVTQLTDEQMNAVLERVAIEDVWGIGPNYACFLRNYGITTARNVRDADEHWLRKYLTVVGAKNPDGAEGHVMSPAGSEAATKATDHLCEKLWQGDYQSGRTGRSGRQLCRARRRKASRAGLAGWAPHGLSPHESVRYKCAAVHQRVRHRPDLSNSVYA